MPHWFISTAMATLLLGGCQQSSQFDQAMQHPANGTPAPALATPAVATPIVTTATITTPAATPIYRAFKDYVVGCDNIQHCTAVAARTDDQIGLTLVLQRDAGPVGTASLKISSITRDPLEADSLMLDDKSSSISKLQWLAGTQGTLELTDAAAIVRFVAMVKDARSIRFGQDQDSELSLAGFKAALSFIDETQGRLDTVTAFATPGQQAADTVPVAPSAPVLAAAYKPVPPTLSEATSTALAKSVREQARDALRTADCAYEASPDAMGNTDDAIALTSTEALVFLTCTSGAYQSEVLVYRAPTDGKQPASQVLLPPTPFTLEDGRATTFETLVGADYDPTTATLSEFSKSRGLADCGSSTTWRFDGKEFLLASFSSMDRCSGVNPDDWPTYWRTQG